MVILNLKDKVEDKPDVISVWRELQPEKATTKATIFKDEILIGNNIQTKNPCKYPNASKSA